MTAEISSAGGIDRGLVGNYFNSLIGMYFKILPLYENKEKSLKTYMENLRDELEGCGKVIEATDRDPRYMSLISTLQFMIDRFDDPECTVEMYRQKVFGAISVCKKLAARYGAEEEK